MVYYITLFIMRAEDNEQKLCTFEMWVLFVSQKKKKKNVGTKFDLSFVKMTSVYILCN